MSIVGRAREGFGGTAVLYDQSCHSPGRIWRSRITVSLQVIEPVPLETMATLEGSLYGIKPTDIPPFLKSHPLQGPTQNLQEFPNRGWHPQAVTVKCLEGHSLFNSLAKIAENNSLWMSSGVQNWLIVWGCLAWLFISLWFWPPALWYLRVFSCIDFFKREVSHSPDHRIVSCSWCLICCSFCGCV